MSVYSFLLSRGMSTYNEKVEEGKRPETRLWLAKKRDGELGRAIATPVLCIESTVQPVQSYDNLAHNGIGMSSDEHCVCLDYKLIQQLVNEFNKPWEHHRELKQLGSIFINIEKCRQSFSLRASALC